jgi:hypothetical protein
LGGDVVNALIELAARCEAAEGPDRELDALISVAVDDGCGIRWHDLWFFTFATGNSPPLYTASLDAALTLLPPGSLWAGGSMEEGPFARLLWPRADGTYVGNYLEITATTPALALCAAALRAKAAA